jgi:1-phosphofructokinase
MIITITMNPAIDKTISIKKLVPGSLNRVSRSRQDAGGKGINVSMMIRELGGKSIATGFMGNDKFIENTLSEKGIECDFVHINAGSRTNIKIAEEDGTVTEINESGFTVSNQDVEKLLNKLEIYACAENIFVLSGSIPKGVDNDIYYKITKLAHSKGAKVIADADGELFKTVLAANPDYIKPNNEELSRFADIKITTDKNELLTAAKSIAKNGIPNIVVSLGAKGALFMLGDYAASCPPLNVKPKSTVGAGDSMVAALALAYDENMSQEDTVKLCMAASAAAVTTQGTTPPSKELVQSLLKDVIISPI